MEKSVLTVCPYCGAGCHINLVTRNGKIVRAEGAPGRTNESRLCLKGMYGWEYLDDTRELTPRLKKPLLRRSRADDFHEVEWDEAIDFASSRLMAIRETYGPDAIMATGSARGPGNEANYVMQKLVRAVFGTNNIDHCARI
jgi:formate dehydrogenase major subunit